MHDKHPSEKGTDLLNIRKHPQATKNLLRKKHSTSHSDARTVVGMWKSQQQNLFPKCPTAKLHGYVTEWDGSGYTSYRFLLLKDLTQMPIHGE